MTSRASLSRVQARHWALVALAAAAALPAGGRVAGGVLAGGAVMGLSVVLYAAAFGFLTDPRRRRLAIAAFSVKLAALFGLGWLVLGSDWSAMPDPLGVAVGITCFPAAAAWEAMRARGN